MPHNQRPSRILFVDDEPNIRATLPVILRRYGFNVRSAATVPEAIEEIKNREFDLLLCDLNIDKSGDGYDVVAAMREVNPRCITIILTAYPGFESAVEGIRHGVDDYLTKPTSADALVALLAEKLASLKPKARILSISYDEPLTRTRQMLLEREGYEVLSARGLAECIEQCERGDFDLFLLGHSIPHSDKLQMIDTFRRRSVAPIVSLRMTLGEHPVEGADYHVDPDPEPLLETIAKIICDKAVRKGLT